MLAIDLSGEQLAPRLGFESVQIDEQLGLEFDLPRLRRWKRVFGERPEEGSRLAVTPPDSQTD